MRSRPAFFAGCCIVMTSCAECVPGRVSDGVSRLTMRNFGAIADALNRDTRCGFGNPALEAHVVGSPGMPGEATWSVDQCELDFSAAPLPITDCNDTLLTLSGKVT